MNRLLQAYRDRGEEVRSLQAEEHTATALLKSALQQMSGFSHYSGNKYRKGERWPAEPQEDNNDAE